MSALRSLRRFYNEIVQEPLPEPFLKMLRELPSFSDGGSGAGGYTEGGPTSLGSDIRHADRASLSIHAAQDAQPHNLNATLSTRSGEGGSNA